MKASPVCLTRGPITKGLVTFAVPILLSNLLQQLYNSIDSAVVGTFAGNEALAAVGSTGALINLLIGLFLGIATGTGVIYAMHYGAGDFKGLKKITDAAYLLSIAAGVFISVFGVIFAPQMLRAMDTPADVMEPSVAYLRVYLAGTVVNLVYNVGAGMIRAGGDSARPLIYLFISGVMNLLLDLLCVAVLDMGTMGAALATVAAQAVSAVLVVVHMMRMPENQRFYPLKMKLDRVALWDVVRISVPCGLQGSMFNIANLLVQADINTFGSVAMAGVAAYSKVDGFIYMPMMALSLSVSTYVGQNIGAGEYRRVRKGIVTCLILSASCAMALAISVLLGFNSVIGLFTKDPAAKAYAYRMMWFLAPFSVVFSISDILGGAMRGAGEAMKVTIISAVCICAYRVVWLIVLLHFYHDIRIVFVCYPISWFLSSGVMAVYYFRHSTIRKSILSSRT